jgi:hypothetical protein
MRVFYHPARESANVFQYERFLNFMSTRISHRGIYGNGHAVFVAPYASSFNTAPHEDGNRS